MIFSNAKIYTEDFEFKKGSFSVENGRFAAVIENGEPGEDLNGALVIPGAIDIHSHGCAGFDFSDGSAEGVEKMARYYAANGVTSFAGTTLTLPYDVIGKAHGAGLELLKNKPEGAAVLRGMYLEGPFFCESRKGAQNAAYLRLPDYEAFKKLNEDCGGLAKIVCVAPELEGAAEFIEKASKDAVVSIAHTDCTYDQAKEAIGAGASQITHLFNAMPSIHHRKPGPIAAAAENPGVSAEIISDGLHVHPAVVQLAFKLFGAERMVLISDSLRCCGMPDGEYSLGGLPCWLKDGVARLEDGTIAGSATNVFECMRRAVSFGIKMEDAIRAATYNPARQLGCLDEVGSISKGKVADFVVCDEGLNIKAVYLAGKKI